jgi:hypothetical protein
MQVHGSRYIGSMQVHGSRRHADATQLELLLYQLCLQGHLVSATGGIVPVSFSFIFSFSLAFSLSFIFSQTHSHSHPYSHSHSLYIFSFSFSLIFSIWFEFSFSFIISHSHSASPSLLLVSFMHNSPKPLLALFMLPGGLCQGQSGALDRWGQRPD